MSLAPVYSFTYGALAYKFYCYCYYYYYYYLASWDKPSRHEDIRKRDENNEIQQASW